MPLKHTMRGIDHVGLAVRDIEMATSFLRAALGAEVIYETHGFGDPPQEGADTERRMNLAPHAQIKAIRMLRLGNGPGIELFEIAAPDQRDPARGSDLGWQHVAVYTDDMDAALRRFADAGGDLLAPPHELPSKERGPGNLFCYARTPFGALVEFISYPSPQPYARTTELRRWVPKRS